ncbi:uncharacterized protein LOC124915260 [Impatiens glandulifera]|uniref:uncharacterized protein LOC124915260 n=1 Tax=Impatiens glandulifera TaxID=253017 RepID=UPI001FB06905|nr:uncharacterized protein LOC124915260 [Impatiens glandulifera]
MASYLSLQLLRFRTQSESSSYLPNFYRKDIRYSWALKGDSSDRLLFARGYSCLQPSRSFLSRAVSPSLSSTESGEIGNKDESAIYQAQHDDFEFNRVNCLGWVLHESARSFSLAIQAHELARSGPAAALAWSGVDVQSWHRYLAYQVAVYALLEAAIEVEVFLSQKPSCNSSPVRDILSAKTNYLAECIESQLSMKHPKLVQWFKVVELPRIAGLFIPLFKKWSMEYSRSGVAGIILAISCCAAVRKLGPGRLSCPMFSVSIEDVFIELMDFSHRIVSVNKLHQLGIEAGFEEDFLQHFGSRVLPSTDIKELEFWIGLVQEKLCLALHRESVISGHRSFSDKIHENSLATLGLFAFLGRETRLFLSEMGIEDLDEQVKDLLSYLECGSLFIYSEFSSLSAYQLFMEVVNDEIGWIDFYAAFRSMLNQDRRKTSKHAFQAEKEIILATVFTVCSDVFFGFAHFIKSTKQPLDANLLPFLRRSQNLLSICLEDYWAAYDRPGAMPRTWGKVDFGSSLSPQTKSGTILSDVLETQKKPINIIRSQDEQTVSLLTKVQAISPEVLDPVTLDMDCYAEAKAFRNELLRISTMKMVSASMELWMGTQLLFIDILDATRLIMKQFHGHKITRRERKKIERTLADIVTLVPVTILMLLPVSAVGHAAMFAAIQKYMPYLIPTSYSPERLDVVKQLKRTKKMEVQSWCSIEDSSSSSMVQ